MRTRQTEPEEWLILTEADFRPAKLLRRGSGVLLLAPLSPAQDRQLRRLGRSHGLRVVREAVRTARRVHNVHELTHALLQRSSMILLSPIYRTASHPEWKPLPRMRAATLARLTNRTAIALGGMDKRRFAAVAPLGFAAWAGISAFRT